MDSQRFVKDAVIGLLSGYAGSKVMDPVTTKLQQFESEEDKRREREASPSAAYDVAARKISEAAGLRLSEEQIASVAIAFHYGLALAAGELYVLLRRSTTLGPVPASLVVGLTLWAGVDEGVNAIFGFSAPPSAYPPATHVRGLMGHLALGFGVAVAAESLTQSMNE
ncbi:MAG: hypothetical protein NVS2B16_22030 [Chloroflexota bacterium]